MYNRRKSIFPVENAQCKHCRLLQQHAIHVTTVQHSEITRVSWKVLHVAIFVSDRKLFTINHHNCHYYLYINYAQYIQHTALTCQEASSAVSSWQIQLHLSTYIKHNVAQGSANFLESKVGWAAAPLPTNLLQAGPPSQRTCCRPDR